MKDLLRPLVVCSQTLLKFGFWLRILIFWRFERESAVGVGVRGSGRCHYMDMKWEYIYREERRVRSRKNTVMGRVLM